MARNNAGVRSRWRQLGIFGGLFGGSKSKSEQKTEATRDATKTQTGTVSTGGTQTTKLIEDPIRRAANSLVVSLVRESMGPNAASANLERLATTLEERGLAAEEQTGKANQATLAAARREGERSVTRLNTDLATAAGGSTMNSFVAGATAEALVDLETQMAALEGDLAMAARNLGTQELAQAVEAFKAAQVAGASDANAISQLIGVLRGANAVTTTDETQTIAMTEQLAEVVNELVKGKSKGSQSLFSQIGLSFSGSRGD